MKTQFKENIARLEPELAALIRRADMVYRHQDYPLERAHYLLLGCLEHGEKNAREIAAILGLDHSTVVRQVTAVESRCLVERLPNLKDRRSVLVRITVEGGRQLAQMRALRRTRYEEVLVGWTAADLQQLASLLGRFNADLMHAYSVLGED